MTCRVKSLVLNTFKTCMSRRTESSYCRAVCMLELLMLKRHILFVPDCDFTASDIDGSYSQYV